METAEVAARGLVAAVALAAMGSACGGQVEQGSTTSTLQRSPVTSATACQVFAANQAALADPYLIQIADRAADPAAATKLAERDPRAAFAARQGTLRTLEEARPLLESSGEAQLVRDLDVVIEAYRAHLVPLERFIAEGGGFLPVGASPSVAKPARAILDYASKRCQVAVPTE